MAAGSGACITIGNFDGFHLGHQALVAFARQIALAENLRFELITFWPHPRVVLKGEDTHAALASRAERARLFAVNGIQDIRELPFTPELSALSADEFVCRELMPAGMKVLVIGHDFNLGHEREGDASRLEALGRRYGFAVRQAPAAKAAGAPISSTRLRALIASGEVEKASEMLGRHYSVGGKVGRGFQRGRSLGFPTANLVEPDALLPGDGVYAVLAHVGGKAYPAVTNIGRNPTFGNTQKSIETFLLDADADLYDVPIRLEFIRRLRDERKFASPDLLAVQIEKDIAAARAAISAAG